jgi:hypothetical protein
MHVLLHAAVAAMMASAAFSVAPAQGWSTARLSQARYYLSATSVGTVAVFAGGENGKLLDVCMYIVLPCGSDCFLMRATAVNAPFYYNVVDLYDSGTGQWSTAQLSVARSRLAATSVGTVAIFAGGTDGKLLRIVFVL